MYSAEQDPHTRPGVTDLYAPDVVQVKDAALPGHRLPLPLGEGTLPLDPFAALLAGAGYQGVVSLEWERKWYPDAAPLEVASASFRRWADAVALTT